MSIEVELEKLEDMLEGRNYTVFFHVYSVQHDIDSDPASIIQSVLPDAVLGWIVDCDVQTALRKFDHNIRYCGSDSHGPDQGVIDSAEFRSVFATVRSDFQTACFSAVSVHDFWLRDGHPAYPVFWGFAFLIRQGKQSDIWIGSSSD